MLDYTLEEVIDFINGEIDEAYENAYCDDIVDTDESCDKCAESVVEAYEDGVISYEAAEEYIDIITEARRLDKEILKRAELLDRFDKIKEDPEIPDKIKDKMYDKVASQTKLEGPSRRLLPVYPSDRHKLIRDAVKNRNHNGVKISASVLNSNLRPAEERKPGKYLEIQKKLNNKKTDLTLPKKVNTKVPKDDGLY